MRVIVVGAGVIGLSCAIRLAERGFEVHVLARDLPLETTSAVAAALWYPYRVAADDAAAAAWDPGSGDAARVAAWAKTTYAELARIATAQPSSGVAMTTGTELLRHATTAAQPWWHAAVPPGVPIENVPPGDLPPGYRDGWRISVPVADMDAYLRWLLGCLEALGATVTRRWLPALPAPTVGSAVVNCTGLGAGGLAQDASVYPVRGQVVRLRRPEGLRDWLVDDSGPADRPLYVVPRGREVIIGGTAEPGNYDLRPDAVTAREIVARAAALVPELAGAQELGHRVGLRPARPHVRLERSRSGTDAGSVVHCYGHGGAGVTLSWGCADEVAELVERVSGEVGRRAGAE
jgi:D-amino-acid oxidase